MRKVTICLLCKGNKLLIGKKKKGFGAGKKNMPGGKIKRWRLEGVRSATKREIFEESHIKIKKEELQQVAIINFYFDGKFVCKAYVFLVKDFSGKATDSKEMDDFRLYSFDKLPFKEMWVADRLWIPLILRDRKKIEAVINFNSEGTKVKNFSYKEVEFD